MRTKWDISLQSFNKELYLAAVEEHVKQLFTRAARLFLLAAVPRVPIYTGFARSAFKNVEDIAGKVSYDRSTKSYKINSKRRGGSAEKSSNKYYEGVLKTTQSGRQFATPSTEIINAKLAKGKTVFYFKFEIRISYFDLLDRTVWGAFKAGNDAMEAFLKANVANGFPDISQFLIRKTV